VTEPVEVRRLRTHEEHLVQLVFDGVSRRSQLTPFRTRAARLSPTLRRALTLSVPGEQVTLVALLQGRAVALGHWLRDESDPWTAQLAVAVADAAQGHGVGRRLVHELAASADGQGVDWFRCPARVEELRVRSWLVAMGARWRDDEVLVHVRTVVARTTI
jgi:GNAT superfamily N-acetyltransferase